MEAHRSLRMNSDLITRHQAHTAVSQLLCLILGKQHARASEHLSQDLSKRLELCFELVERENHQALQSNDVDFARAALNAGQRKLTSLQSLKTINQLIQECEW